MVSTRSGEGVPTSKKISNTIYLQIAADPTEEGFGPTRLPAPVQTPVASTDF